MSKTANRPIRVVRRHYLWLDGQVWRLTNNLHTGLVAGEIRFPNFANTRQRLLAVTASGAMHRRRLDVQSSTYAFDKDGRFDVADQADAVQDITGVNRSQNNVMDVRRVLGARRWVREHHWELPLNAIRQVEADLWPEKRRADFKAAPILRPPRSS
jgi:hypothetical protein